MTPIRAALFALLTTTALLAQPRWEQRITAPAPADRFGASMAFDSVREVAVLFGGDPFLQPPFADTWEWNGAGWTQRNPAHAPPPLASHRMAYDSSRRRVVLFGGVSSGGALSGQTWEWDGSDWTERRPGQSPPDRSLHAMAFDAARGVVVLFGGFDGNRLFDDTWEWDGVDWSRIQTNRVPPARAGHAMAYDAGSGDVVLFGGQRFVNRRDDTWVYDGIDWSERTPTTRPPGRADHTLIYDALRRRTVLCGGSSSPTVADIWEWDGGDWELRSPANPPGERRTHTAVYDSVRQEMLLFGGSNGGGTWTYGTDRPAAATPFGSGCAGSAGTPSLSLELLAWLGDALRAVAAPLVPDARCGLLLGLSNGSWQGIGLPLALDAAGAPGCSLLVSPDDVLATVAAQGIATWSAPVPQDPSLAGRSIYLQAVVLDPAANPLGVATSAGLEVRFGIR